MASGKLSPRQKMINMMYLVLTALLAMNVSSEILNAFKTVNRSLDKTITILNGKISDNYSAFQDALAEPQTKEKALVWEPVAKQISAKSNDLVAYIEQYKEKVKDGAGRKKGEKNEAGEEVFKDDDLDVATRIFIESKDKKGAELYNKMDQYKKEVLAILASQKSDNPALNEQLEHDIKRFESSLPINLGFPERDHDGKKYEKGAAGWAFSNFHMTPAIAAITILTKLQSDIKGTEGQLSDYCLSQLGKVKFVYDKFAAVAAANTTYCMPGDPIEVSAGVGAFNDQAKPQISIKGANVPLNAEGMSVYKFNAGTPGEYSIPVSIRFTTPAGEVKSENRTIKYTVGQPAGAALMLDKMNVFYIGLDNPVTVSSGTGDEKTNVAASGGGVTLRKTAPGKYVVRATTVGESTLTITGDGKSTAYKFRVKRVPDPITTIGGTIEGGKIQKGVLGAQQGLIALLKNFDFDAKFEVQGFEFTYVPKNGDLSAGVCSGPRFNDQLVNAIKNCKPKDVFLIESVKVKGPDGTVRKIQGISVQII